jgi:signal transduction histidine kinase
MDRKTERILSLILWIFLIWSSIYILTYSGNNVKLLAVLLGLLCLSILLSMNLNNVLRIKHYDFNTNIYLECALIYWIARYDNSGASQVLFYLLVSSAIIRFKVKTGLVFSGINFVSFVIINFIRLGDPSISQMVTITLENLLSFCFVFGFSYVAKLEIVQREKLDKTKKELEKAYEKLQESYDTKEQLLIERERNKIAGEIHDTVGHTLTTVIVELEAAKRLMKKDMERSLEKLDLAQEQVRKGLNDIRTSVRALKAGEEVLDFVTSLESLIRETEKHSGVTFEYTIADIRELDKDIHRVLLRALQEGLTNGIRHGKSSKFKLSIFLKDNYINFNLEDNGCGGDNFQPGFGLSNMKHRVEQLNGTLSVAMEKGKGCSLKIQIPLADKEKQSLKSLSIQGKE